MLIIIFSSLIVNLFMHIFLYILDLPIKSFFTKINLKYEALASYIITSLMIILFILLSSTFLKEKIYISRFLMYFFSLSLLFIYDSIFKPIVVKLFNGGERNEVFEQFLREKGYRYNVYITNSEGINAYAMGLLKNYRIILITKGMFENMNPDDSKTILLHEVGHHEKKHISSFFIIFITYNFLFSFFIVKIGSYFSNYHVSNQVKYMPILMGAYGLITYYILSIKKQREYEADLFASRHMGKENLIQALENFNSITNGKLERGGITHPTLIKRIENVQAKP